MPDAVCVVLPVHNPAHLAAVADWRKAVAHLDRPAELVLVDDGCLVPVELDGVRILRHDNRCGAGACLRTALAATDSPVIVTAALDYPYAPTDLPALLKELDTEHEVIAGKLKPAVVSGCRTGRPASAVWRTAGTIYRLAARVCCGFRPEKPPGWLGVRGHWHSWLGWLLFANPLHDPDSAYKAYRRELFDLFPVESDYDFAVVEVVAKATFCTRLVAEVPLSPAPAEVPAADWAGWRRVLARPAFTPVVAHA